MFLRRVPLFVPVVCMAAGIIVSALLKPGWWIIIPVLTITVILFYLKYTYPGIWISSFLIGLMVSQLAVPEINACLFDGNDATYTGKVLKVSETDIGERFIVEIYQVQTGERTHKIRNAKIVVNLFEFLSSIRPYDIIKFRTQLKANNYDPELPGDPDYTNYYRYNSIVGSGFVEPDNLMIIGKDKSFKAKFYNWRTAASRVLEESGISRECFILLNAVLLGDTESLRADEQQLFADAGLAHILALSGTHVAIIGSFVFFLLLPLRALGWRKGVYIACIVILWFYAFLSGLSASVVRASTMISVLFIARLVSRPPNSLNSLCFAAILILMFNPNAIFSPSFQLSFSAVACILLFADILKDLRLKNRITGYFIGIVYVTSASLVGTALLSAYYFHKFPVYSLLSNIPCSILLPVFLIVGIILIIIGLFDLRLYFIADIADWIYKAMTDVAKFFSGMPDSTIGNIYFHAWIFIPFIASVVLSAVFIKTKARIPGILASLCFIIVILSFVYPVRDKSSIKYYFTGTRNSTEIIMENNGSIFITSSCRPEEYRQTLERLKRKHKDFFSLYGTDGIYCLEEFTQTGQLRKNGRLLEIGNKTIAFITSESDILRELPGGRADYAIITKSFGSGDILKTINKLNIDTVILPKELHLNYVRKLEPVLRASGVPFYNLREQKLWRTTDTATF